MNSLTAMEKNPCGMGFDAALAYGCMMAETIKAEI